MAKQTSVLALAEDENIYRFVKSKLELHGAGNTDEGSLVFGPEIFVHFVALERAIRTEDFDAVLHQEARLNEVLCVLRKRELMAFFYLYAMFSNALPEETKVDVFSDGCVMEEAMCREKTSDVQKLISLWGRVKYHGVGQALLGIVYKGDNDV